jgi:hypothetical protein
LSFGDSREADRLSANRLSFLGRLPVSLVFMGKAVWLASHRLRQLFHFIVTLDISHADMIYAVDESVPKTIGDLISP